MSWHCSIWVNPSESVVPFPGQLTHIESNIPPIHPPSTNVLMGHGVQGTHTSSCAGHLFNNNVPIGQDTFLHSEPSTNDWWEYNATMSINTDQSLYIVKIIIMYLYKYIICWYILQLTKLHFNSHACCITYPHVRDISPYYWRYCERTSFVYLYKWRKFYLTVISIWHESWSWRSCTDGRARCVGHINVRNIEKIDANPC